MKKVLIPVVGTIGAGVIVISGISNFANAEKTAASPEHRLLSSAAKTGEAGRSQGLPEPVLENSLGLVNIDYTIQQLSRKDSNQITIWIEDEKGNFVKSLLSKFSSAQESVNRPESFEGSHSIYWNCRDHAFQPVKPGTYTYKLEVSTNWERRVLYSGTIQVGDNKDSSSASPTSLPNANNGDVIEVGPFTASFAPLETLDALGVAVTRTRGS